MKCFIHFNKEAIASCKECGKGMCANCSAYSGHSGLCPVCRKKEFERKIVYLHSEKKDTIWNIVKWSLLAVLVITIPVSAGIIIYDAFKIKKYNAEILNYQMEIAKLDKATSRGSATI